MADMFEVKGLKELEEQMTIAVKRYPDMAETCLIRTGTKFKAAIIKKIKESTKEKTGNLTKSSYFTLSKTRGYGVNMEKDFSATAPHFHLIEHGHEKVTQRTRNGKTVLSGGKNIGFTPGKHVMKLTIEEFGQEMPKILGSELDKLLKKSGLA